MDLLPWWDDFVAYRDKLNLKDDELLELLDRRKKKAKLLQVKKSRQLDDAAQKVEIFTLH